MCIRDSYDIIQLLSFLHKCSALFDELGVGLGRQITDVAIYIPNKFCSQNYFLLLFNSSFATKYYILGVKEASFNVLFNTGLYANYTEEYFINRAYLVHSSKTNVFKNIVLGTFCMDYLVSYVSILYHFVCLYDLC